MGLLDNLFRRTLAPGDLPFRRRAGTVQAATLAPAVYGMRVEIPRVERRLLPYALDFEDGVGEGSVGRQIYKGYLAAPSYPTPTTPPIYTPPIYQYPPGTVPPPSVGGAPPATPPGTVPGAIETPGLTYIPPPAEFPTPSAPGYRRAFNLQFSADTAGSSATQEIRVTPAIGHPFRITELDISPLAGVVVGQYIDVLVVPNAEMIDAAAFLGASLFEQPALLNSIPTPDAQRGIAVPLQTKRFENLGPVFQAGQQIKVVVFFTAPALAMPTLSITLIVEEVIFSTPLPPPRVPPVDIPPFSQPPISVLPPPPPAPPSPPIPSEPPGTLPTVPYPHYNIITVVPGVTMLTNWIPQYDTAGHIVAYIQDPAQIAQWDTIRAQYTAARAGATTAT